MKEFPAVYGPVRSWRYGLSLGIDPIGIVSTCSFNCVYCQLGQIERSSLQRQTFVPTADILSLVQTKITSFLDVITLSGSGEPTLALNLGEIITAVKQITTIPLVVLTNGSLLGLEAVRSDLQLADEVSIKLDGISKDQINRVNRPAFAWDWEQLCGHISALRQSFRGKLTIQTMLLSAWHDQEREAYINGLNLIQPDRVYLNSPRRPKPKQRLVEGRENLTTIAAGTWFKPIDLDYLTAFAEEIKDRSGCPVSFVVVNE